MPTGAHRITHDLTERIAAWLARSGRWGTRAEAARRINGVSESIQSAVDCSFLLTDFDLDGSVFYVPHAIEFARELPFADLPDKEYAHQLECTCGALLTFLKTWRIALDEADLAEPIIEAINAMRDDWTSTFPPPRSQFGSNGAAESGELWPATILLNTPLESATIHNDGTLFACLLSRWTENLQSAAVSANLLALFFSVRYAGGHMQLFKDPFMIRCASDTDLCERHWRVAAPLLASACGTEYTDLLRLELLET